MRRHTTLLSFIFILSFALNAQEAFLSPTDKMISYMGRIDFPSQTEARFDWPGSSVEINFKGTEVSIILSETKNNEYNVYIDGKFHQKLSPKKGTHKYILATNLPKKNYNVRLSKRTEGDYGVSVFKGFVAPEGTEFSSTNKTYKKHIEFIGDSMTVGFGNQGPNAPCNSENYYEDNDMAYGPRLARSIDADYHVIAASGRGMVHNYMDKKVSSDLPIPALYDRAVHNDKTEKWNPTSWTPQVVVLGLGHNDFSTQPHPSKELFVKEYRKFLKTVYANYPNTSVLITCTETPILKEYLTEIYKQEKASGNEQIAIKLYGPFPPEEMGCAGHPNSLGHERIRKTLKPIVEQMIANSEKNLPCELKLPDPESEKIKKTFGPILKKLKKK